MEAIDLYNEETAKMKEQGGGRDQVNISSLFLFYRATVREKGKLQLTRSAKLGECIVLKRVYRSQ